MVKAISNKAENIETKPFVPTKDDIIGYFYLMLEQCGGSISIDETVPLPKKLRLDCSRCGDKAIIMIPENHVRKLKKKTKLVLPNKNLILPDRS